MKFPPTQIINVYIHKQAVIIFCQREAALINENRLYVCLVLNFRPQYVGSKLMKKPFDLLIAPLSTKI